MALKFQGNNMSECQRQNILFDNSFLREILVYRLLKSFVRKRLL